MGSFVNVREDAMEVNWQRYARLWVECPYQNSNSSSGVMLHVLMQDIGDGGSLYVLLFL